MNFQSLVLHASSVIAVGVGLFALIAPAKLLESKGAALSAAAVVWVREVGVNIFALGVMAFLLRGEPMSPALRAFFIGNAIVQFGLLPIEILAWRRGTLTRVSGIVPNSILHAVLGSAFVFLSMT
jgi:hypothetical protein